MSNYEEVFGQLRAAYVTRLKSSAEAIDNILARKQILPLVQADLQRAERLAHGLAGSAAIFDFPEVSEAGQKAELLSTGILKALPPGDFISEKDYTALEETLIALREICLSNYKKNAQLAQKTRVATQEKEPEEEFVLIVENDSDIAQLLAAKFEENGIRAMVAPDGKQGLKAAHARRPDLIILDVMMPHMNGHEVLQNLKQDPEFVNIPVLMATAKNQRQDFVDATHSGAIDYIKKPYNPEAVVKRAQEVIQANRRTILIADDDSFIRELLESRYKYMGFKTLCAASGGEAWKLIGETLPDLVVLDVQMPEMDGIEVLQKMRQAPSTKAIPVIILSTLADRKHIASGMESGAQEYLTKPFSSDKLIECTNRLLQNHPGIGA